MAKKAPKPAEEIGSSRELYNFLFEACNIIRGPVSQDAFKEYITPLLYFKRRLGNKDYAADLMGDAYEMLLKKFADLSKATNYVYC
jgi:type I restriction-modification system DNA methylase subunit